MADWFTFGKNTLSVEQMRVLKKTQRYFQGDTDQALKEEELQVIGSILLQFSPA